MGKLFGKKTAVAEQPCCKECNSVEEKKYEVTFILTDKYWNEDLKRYLFAGFGRDGAIMVSETPEVTTVTSEVWRVNDLLYSGALSQITIKSV